MPNYESIRPYRDEEVPSVVRRLTASVDLRDGIASFLFPRLYKFSAVATRGLTAALLRYRARELSTVLDVQMMVGRFIDHMLEATVEELSWSGLTHLPQNKPYLFISNHRDITLDSALLNRVLHEEGFPTSQIAVGDNLFGTPYADDLMRLNRGFLVERSAGGPKAVYAALSRTSGFVRDSIENGNSVWIAQREGRAKDGYDRTDPALIKMLALAWRSADKPLGQTAEQQRLNSFLAKVTLVPVAISYEADPCDEDKARELHVRASQGEFTKPPGADLDSIVQGMRGYKGRVHLNFAAPLTGPFGSADAVAEALDLAIVGGLQVYPSNRYALQTLVQREPEFRTGAAHSMLKALLSSMGQAQPETATSGDESAAANRAVTELAARVASTALEQQPYLLAQYANVLRNRAELGFAASSPQGDGVSSIAGLAKAQRLHTSKR